MHSHPRWHSVAALLVILVVAVVTVSSLELITRTAYTLLVAATGGLTFGGSDGWYNLSPELGWVLRPHYAGNVYWEFRQFDGDGFLEIDRQQIAEPGRPRVVFVGDSTTYGYGVETRDTFVEVLDEWFPEADMINLGVPAYTSTQGYRVVQREALALRPSVIVFSFNFNDRRYVTKAENTDDADRFADTYWALVRARTVERLFLYRAATPSLRYLAPAGPEPEEQPVALDFGFTEDRGPADLTPDRLRARVGPEQYVRNLTSVAELARAHDIGLIFVLFNDNPLVTADLERGLALYHDSRYEEAIQALQFAVDNRDEFSPLARLQLSAIYADLGRERESREVLTFADNDWLHGEMPLHRDRLYNDLMEQVAAEQAIPVVDPRQLLDRDPGVYIDFAHFDARGHQMVAGLLKDVISTLLPTP